MRIAFDVKGTLEGHYATEIIALFKALQTRGHECVVWSSSFCYAVEAILALGLNAYPKSKKMMMDLNNEDDAFDYCIEDDQNQTWLAAKRFIWAREVSADIESLILDMEMGQGGRSFSRKTE